MLFVFGMLSLALGACKKNDPVTPTPDPKPQPAPKPAPTPDQPKPTPDQPKPTPEQPKPSPEEPKPQPAPEAHFNQSEVSVRIGKSVSATLENFTGMLTQEGTVDGFTAKIEKNVVTITADSYKPGKHDFTFKGGDKSYKLTVNLEKLPEIQGDYAIYDLDLVKPVFVVNHHVNNSKSGQISVTVAHKEGDKVESFILFNIESLTDDVVGFSATAHNLKPLEGDKPYLSSKSHNGQKGIVIKKPNANSTVLSFVATVEGKYIYVSFDTEKQ